MISFDDVRKKYNGLYPGFHFLRHALALTILFHHTRILLRGVEKGTDGYVKGDIASTVGASGLLHLDGHFFVELLRPLLFALVGGFFALSGFLVADSAFRTRNVRAFLMLRVLRIVPALLSEVTLSAFFIGAAVTSLPIGEYFARPELYAYFGNVIGYIHYNLPGVFLTNPIAETVNANLWTLPSELYCYVILSGLMITGIVYNRKLFTLFFILLSIGAFAIPYITPDMPTRSDSTHFSNWFIVYCFFIGVAFSIYARNIPVSRWLFAIAGLVYLLGMLFNLSDIFSSVCLVYCTIFIGTREFAWFNRFMKADYSYGFYLYGYPIAQTVIYFMGCLGLIAVSHAAALLIVVSMTFGLTFLFAAMSWKYIEKPCLGMKRYFIKKA